MIDKKREAAILELTGCSSMDEVAGKEIHLPIRVAYEMFVRGDAASAERIEMAGELLEASRDMMSQLIRYGYPEFKTQAAHDEYEAVTERFSVAITKARAALGKDATTTGETK